MGIKIDLSFAGSKVQGMTCLSLQVFSDKWVEPYSFPADFSRVKSESLREEKQQQQSHLPSVFT